MIDLHTHSDVSDGCYSPRGLMEEAINHGLCAIALTDHDSLGGLEEASKAALKLGIRFIPGIEVEISRKNDISGDFHVLGLGLNRPTPEFMAAVEELARRREERNLEIAERIKNAGIEISYDEIRGPLQAKRSIGRLHFAQFLIKQKVVRNLDQAFKRYLGRGKPFYIPKAGLEFEQAVELIHKSGGIAVLAHPMSLYVSWGKLPDLIKSLKDRGLDGLEAWHPNAKVSCCKRLEALGEKLSLCITAGSDFHGKARPDRKLGITAGGKKINDSYLEGIPLDR